MFRPGVDDYVMNRDRLLDAAVRAAIELRDGYAVETRAPIAMPGRDARQRMCDWLDDARERGRLTPHDVTTGKSIAMIVTGGDVDAGTELTENDLFDLEREAFVALGRTTRTRDRVRFMLEHGTPLRN